MIDAEMYAIKDGAIRGITCYLAVNCRMRVLSKILLSGTPQFLSGGLFWGRRAWRGGVLDLVAVQRLWDARNLPRFNCCIISVRPYFCMKEAYCLPVAYAGSLRELGDSCDLSTG